MIRISYHESDYPSGAFNIGDRFSQRRANNLQHLDRLGLSFQVHFLVYPDVV